jgi:hypothetical protein
MVSDDVFMQIATSKANAGGTPLRDGEGEAVIKRILTQKGHEGIFFIAEVRVLNSRKVDVPENLRLPAEKGIEITPNPEGSDCSFVCNLSKEMGPGNAKAFLLAVDGTPEEVVNRDPAKFAAMIKAASSPNNPLRGARFKFTSFRKARKKGPQVGVPFTAFRFETVYPASWGDAEKLADMAAHKAKLGDA